MGTETRRRRAGGILAPDQGSLERAAAWVFFLYPDLFVRWGQERGDPYFRTDPLLLGEVLSPNRQRDDKGDKRLAYQSLPSLHDHVLVTQDALRVEVLVRTEAGWETRLSELLDATLALSSIALALPLSEVYA